MFLLYRFKQCTKCKQWKPILMYYFRFRKGNKNGLCSQCRECERRYSIQYYYEHKDKCCEYSRIFCATNPEKSHSNSKKWHIKNRDKHLQLNNSWHRNNKTKKSVYTKNWRKNNPIKLRVQQNRRRSYKKGADGFHTEDDLKEIWKQQEGKCYYCGVELNLLENSKRHVDHKIPLSRGGSNWPANLCWTCCFCNLSKNNKTEDEYREKI